MPDLWLSNGLPLANLPSSPLFRARKVTNGDFDAPEWMQAPMNKLPITAGGHSALEDELTNRIRIERPRLIQRIQEAIADDSNLAENSEYQAAKTEQKSTRPVLPNWKTSSRVLKSLMSVSSPAIPSNSGPR